METHTNAQKGIAMSTYLRNIEVIQKGTMASQSGESVNIVNSFHYVTTPASIVTAPNIGTFRTNWKAALGAAWRAFLSAGYVDAGVSIRWMDSVTNVAVEFTAGAGLGDGSVGTVDTAIAPNLTVSIKLGTLKRGKNYRGAKRFSPLDESLTKKGELDPAGVILFDALNVALFTTFTDGTDTYSLAVWSQTLSQVISDPVNIVSTIANFSRSEANKTLGQLKSRKFKRLTS